MNFSPAGETAMPVQRAIELVKGFPAPGEVQRELLGSPNGGHQVSCRNGRGLLSDGHSHTEVDPNLLGCVLSLFLSHGIIESEIGFGF